uniref:Uncharacterized protein n=1 Tax=Chromera velia CCMP2878 TaxID=1169474 RepID=A0A0G4I3K6_9ALVE|eukprot:Cvel_10616.t1-p1 / transcript=Cvel_10616.t1 / gene=Cvel_10616 / organism=Chromera_velia_CCMP2878 / gene_product=Putative ankyrin repeat protein L93, putative / transcript_product=Putative ankyrin repeat protein L93, putative / location=Cvel_scaffold644:58408-58950(-) / protein_length=181 / sequence_SO=supercontig / SO=protein_coding / is_pseudo=false
MKITVRPSFKEESLVHFFSWHEFEELLLLSVSRGVDINAVDRDGWTALMSAAARTRPQHVKLLVENGADVNKQDGQSETTLNLAMPRSPYRASYRDESFISSVRTILDILMDGGADVNARGSEGETALHRAVYWGATDVVRCLVERGANLQARNEDGNTPHQLAVQLSRSREMVELLLLRY